MQKKTESFLRVVVFPVPNEFIPPTAQTVYEKCGRHRYLDLYLSDAEQGNSKASHPPQVRCPKQMI